MKRLILLLALLAVAAFGAEYSAREKVVTPKEHAWFFSEPEIVEILKAHLKAQGSNVPSSGRERIWGLEYPPSYSERSRGVTLKIEEAP